MQFAAIYICWGLFVGIWAIGALYNARYAPRTVRRALAPGIRWWPGLIVAVAGVLVARAFIPRGVWAAFSFRTDVLADIGVIVLGGSTLFALWARWTLGIMWSGVPALREKHELRTDGPYRVTRHPIYTGILGMQLGTALIVGSGWIVVAMVVSIGVFLLRITREEQFMLQTFGDQYVHYRRRVPRLVPFATLPLARTRSRDAS
jgi:protein-S-isoprenylcysteine O-methyltransferase Ste14